jgi:Protein of unknown function (DUF4232)
MRPPSLLLIPIAVLLAACETPGPQPPVAVNHVHATPTPAATPTPDPGAQATPAPSPTPAAPDRCHTGGLLISFAGSQGAAGTIVDTFRVANTLSTPCSLYGFVGMLMLDGSGGPVTTRVVRNGGIFSTQAGPSRFVLQPGTTASFQAAWSDVPHRSETVCPQAAQLEITPPDEFDHVIIPVSGWSLAPCGGGEIDVTPIRAAGAGPA